MASELQDTNAIPESGQARVLSGGLDYVGVQGLITFGMFDTLEESPLMNEEPLVEALNNFAQYLEDQIVRPAVAEIRSSVERIHEPKSLSEMFGEYFREAAVLILIFVPVDLLIPKGESQAHSVNVKWLILTLVLSLSMLAFGMWLERRK